MTDKLLSEVKKLIAKDKNLAATMEQFTNEFPRTTQNGQDLAKIGASLMYAELSKNFNTLLEELMKDLPEVMY